MITTLNQHKRDYFESVFLRGGAVSIILGILSTVFELVTFNFYKENIEGEAFHSLANIGTGLWCGALYFIVGVSTIIAGKKLSSKMVVLGVTLAVFSFLLGTAQLTIEILSAQIHTTTVSKNASSARSLHAMLGCVAILVMIAAAIEITFFFRISFCFLTTAVPHRDFSNSSNCSQTEVTRDVCALNEKKIKVAYREPDYEMSELKVGSTSQREIICTV